MGIAVTAARFILMILNTVFVVLGICLVLAGVIVRYLGDQIIQLISPALNQINAFSSITGYTAELTTTTNGFDIQAILVENSIAFIAIGTILGAIAIFGCVGACCGLRILLFVYGIMLCIIVAAQLLAIGIVAGRYDFYRGEAITYINKAAETEYRGTNASDVFSLLVNCVQMNLKCCGVTNYTDWHKAKNWDRTQDYYPFELNVNTSPMPKPFEIPVACCQMKLPYPSITPIDVNCTSTPTTANSFYNVACFTFIEQKIKEYELYAILSTAGLILVQVLIIIASFLIWKKLGKD
ncbi:tetraspanin-3-like isoform X2 [Lineus longissimus]|uniref:tetraspanin-3-like isoform X2 n=1 Tax=Lineus longissimus TaxID=88925 RepID=UPI002B4EB616